jgi:cytochrome c biogenesis protein
VQIILLAVAGLIGTLVPQLPAFTLHNPAAYADAMADMHRRYESLIVLGLNVGPGMVDIFERVGFFRVFSAPWFIFLLTLLVVSITVCTIDRTPRLWRSVRIVKPAQPPAFFDLRLAERARFSGVDDTALDTVAEVLRSRRFVTQRTEQASARHVYGDRNRYFKLATTATHLGLILFLAGGAVTTALGFETVLFVGEGQTAPVQAVGTPDNMLVKNIKFDAPTRPDGSFIDFRTDLAVFQNGQQIARKTIRVNDPLEVNGFVFHQNTFGPAAVLEIRDRAGTLVWDGPVLLAGELASRPQGFITIPGSTIGLLLVLDRTADGIPVLAVTGLAASADNPEEAEIVFLRGLGLGATTDPDATAGYAISWRQASAFTGMVIKRDPGAVLIWIAYLALIAGLVLTFYFPRRRAWARLDSASGTLGVALTADRYANAEREFEALIEELQARLGRRAEMRPATRS